jgi:hypothetical protein
MIESVIGFSAFIIGAITAHIGLSGYINKRINSETESLKAEILAHSDLKFAQKADISKMEITLTKIEKDIELLLFRLGPIEPSKTTS